MKILFAILICITLCGCASVPIPIVFNHAKISIGMTKKQLMKEYGAPNSWSRQVINGKTYEAWYYYDFSETYDFVDNALAGYSSRSVYHSENNTEDVRNYPSK